MSAFIDQYRDRFGVELICRTLEVSASAYYQRRSGERSARRVEDERLLAKIRTIFAQSTTSATECAGCTSRCCTTASGSAVTESPA